MPITRLEMVSSAFHSQAKRGRNAGETQPKPERPPAKNKLVHWYKPSESNMSGIYSQLA